MSKNCAYIKDGLTESDSRIPWTILIAFIVLGSVLFTLHQFTVIDVKMNLVELGGDVFLKYLFIIVAVERAAAVYVGMLRNKGKVDWTLRINRLSEVLQKDNPPSQVLKLTHAREHRLVTELVKAEKIMKIDDVPQQPSDNDYIGYLTSVKHAYEFQRARFNSIGNRAVARIVFFAGIFLAILGLSILGDLMQDIDLLSAMQEQIKNGALTESGLRWQTGFLRFADIVITGGLLGGGSAGLNAVANKVTEFLNKT